ncbi:MAG: hypothetical protein WDW38_003469 [Sanguina aurantia]
MSPPTPASTPYGSKLLSSIHAMVPCLQPLQAPSLQSAAAATAVHADLILLQACCAQSPQLLADLRHSIASLTRKLDAARARAHPSLHLHGEDPAGTSATDGGSLHTHPIPPDSLKADGGVLTAADSHAVPTPTPSALPKSPEGCTLRSGTGPDEAGGRVTGAVCPDACQGGRDVGSIGPALPGVEGGDPHAACTDSRQRPVAAQLAAAAWSGEDVLLLVAAAAGGLERESSLLASVATAISAPCSPELHSNWADLCELRPFLDDELLAFIQAVAAALD